MNFSVQRQQKCSYIWSYNDLFHVTNLSSYKEIISIDSHNKTRENAVVEYLDYQIPVTQIKGPKGNGDMQAARRDWNAPPTRDVNILLCGR